MKIVAISDQHGVLPAIPPCDLLLIGGDVCPIQNHQIDYQAAWLDSEFRAWLRSLTHVNKIIGVAGNHDFIFEHAPQRVPHDLPWTYLQDSGAEYAGLKFWGSPWQPWFHDWAFNANPDQLKAIWEKIPDYTDLFVLHGPPLGYGDGIPEVSGLRQTGCAHLLQRIHQVRPRLVIFGHIHEGRGEWQIGNTTLANVTILDAAYRHVYEPWVIEMALPS
jgi:Icc-related predicted phosphoesterase